MTRSTPDELVGQFPGLAGTRLGLELVDQIDSGKEAHAGAVAHAIGADRDGDMALAGAGSADQHGVALGCQKAALVQFAHQPLVDRRDREVELGKVLHHREARHPHAVGGRAGAMIGELGEQQFAEDALNRVLGAQSCRHHLVVGGAHAGQLQLAHQRDDLMPLHEYASSADTTAQLVVAGAIGDRLDRQC